MSKASKIGVVTRTILWLQFIVAAAFVCMAEQAPQGDGQFVAPEYFADMSRSSVCIWKVAFDPRYSAVLRGSVPNFVAYMYTESRGWTRNVDVIGADYSSFGSLTVVYDSPCRPALTPYAALKTFFPAGSYHAEAVARSPYVSSLEVGKSLTNGLDNFLQFLGQGRLKGCLVQLTAPDIANASESSDKLYRVWKHYHLPFSDVAEIKEKIYVLFSRQCEKKDQMFENIRYVAKIEYPASGLGPVRSTFSPDVSEYLKLRNIP